MRIEIEYDSCWQNSVLSGTNNEQLPKKGREFIATSKSLKIERKGITKNTVLGVLCRLVGDQRKLYQARASDNYVFKDIEYLISFETLQYAEKVWQEVIYIRNSKTNTNPQHSVSGAIRDDTKLFFSEHSAQLWSVLFLDFKSILDFIIKDETQKPTRDNVSPSQLVRRVQEIQSFEKYDFLRNRITKLTEKSKKLSRSMVALSDELKSVEGKLRKKIERKQSKLDDYIAEIEKERKKLETNQAEIDLQNSIDEVVKKLTNEFPNDKNEQPYIKKSGLVEYIGIYAAALYLQLQRMKNQGIDTSELKTEKGKIQGFSNWGFNGIRDFLYPFSTGGKARNQGNPYKDKNGQALTKASGTLEILC